jgi:hypothetical protein
MTKVTFSAIKTQTYLTNLIRRFFTTENTEITERRKNFCNRFLLLTFGFISAEKEQRRRGRREEILCFFFAEAKKRTNCRREIVGDWHLF